MKSRSKLDNKQPSMINFLSRSKTINEEKTGIEEENKTSPSVLMKKMPRKIPECINLESSDDDDDFQPSFATQRPRPLILRSPTRTQQQKISDSSSSAESDDNNNDNEDNKFELRSKTNLIIQKTPIKTKYSFDSIDDIIKQDGAYKSAEDKLMENLSKLKSSPIKLNSCNKSLNLSFEKIEETKKQNDSFENKNTSNLNEKINSNNCSTLENKKILESNKNEECLLLDEDSFSISEQQQKEKNENNESYSDMISKLSKFLNNDDENKKQVTSNDNTNSIVKNTIINDEEQIKSNSDLFKENSKQNTDDNFQTSEKSININNVDSFQHKKISIKFDEKLDEYIDDLLQSTAFNTKEQNSMILKANLTFFKTTHLDLLEKYCSIIDQIPPEYFKMFIEDFNLNTFLKLKRIRQKSKQKSN